MPRGKERAPATRTSRTLDLTLNWRNDRNGAALARMQYFIVTSLLLHGEVRCGELKQHDRENRKEQADTNSEILLWGMGGHYSTEKISIT